MVRKMPNTMQKSLAALVLAIGCAASACAQGSAGATITVSGSENSSGGSYDAGTIGITINGHAKTFTYGIGQYASTASVASFVAAHISQDTAEPVWAKVLSPGSSVITLAPRVPGTPVSVTTAAETPSSGFSASFTFSTTAVTVAPSLELHCTPRTLGTDQTADCIASITGISAEEGAAHTPANPIVFTVNSSAWTTSAVAADGTATALSLAETTAATYTVTAAYSATSPNTDSYYAAMSATTTVTFSSGDPTTSAIYNYSIKDGSGNSGYDGAGNIVAYSDSVNGVWTLSYDPLDRLAGASSSPAIQTGTPYACWNYDSFGNRLSQNFGSSAFSGGGISACSGGGSTTATNGQTYAANNRLSSMTLPSSSFTYDDAGDLTSDGTRSYVYDAEGRVCAMSVTVESITSYYGYLYNAEGQRVAKGTISSLSCNLSTNEFTVTNSYILGPDGSTMTELDGSGSWKHTDVPAGVGTMAVYDTTGLHYRFSDWLGSHRIQTDYQGTATPEDAYQSLPFGELVGSAAGATEKHFTGKEHDDESGNDYFIARYYASSMGRWMTPDWSRKTEAIPYAKLGNPQSFNLYGYLLNNPLRTVDADGHDGLNSTNPCNGAKNCTSNVTEVRESVKYDPKTDTTKLTVVNNLVATINNADGTSTRVSALATTTTIFNGDGKAVSATQSQSGALVENFNKPNAQGGDTFGFASPVAEHRIGLDFAAATVKSWDMQDGEEEKVWYMIAQGHGYDRYTGQPVHSNGEILENANTILEGIREALKP